MRVRRIVLCVALVLGFTTTSAATGAPVAGADAVDCHFYLLFKGFSGLIIDSGCGFGEDGNTGTCEDVLEWSRVTPRAVVVEACRLAALP
jgi:hypothetical protein